MKMKTCKKDKYLKTDMVVTEDFLGVLEDSIDSNPKLSQEEKDDYVTVLYHNFYWVNIYGPAQLVKV
jgi:hypothetical protein